METTTKESDTTSMSSGDTGVGNVTNSSNFNINIVYLSIGLLGMLGNTVVICVMMRSPTLRRKSTNILILNQSLIDSCAAAFVIAHAMLRNLSLGTDRVTQDIFCRLLKSSLPMWGLFVSSTYNLIAMTLDRYLALVHPIVHRNRCSRKIIYVNMALVWVFGLGWQSSYTIPTSGLSESGKCIIYEMYPSLQIQMFMGILVVTLQYFIPLFIIIFAYTSIALVLRRGLKISGGNDAHGTSQTREQLMLEASKKVFKILLTVSVPFVVCWSPNQILYIMYNFGVPVDFESTLFHFSIVLAFLNCCINPIIYCLRYEEFQQELRRQVKCWKTVSSETSNDCSTPRQQQPDKPYVSVGERKTDTTSDTCTYTENRSVVSAMERETQQDRYNENRQVIATVDREKQSEIGIMCTRL